MTSFLRDVNGREVKSSNAPIDIHQLIYNSAEQIQYVRTWSQGHTGSLPSLKNQKVEVSTYQAQAALATED